MKSINLRIMFNCPWSDFKHREAVDEFLKDQGLTGRWDLYGPMITLRRIDPAKVLAVMEMCLNLNTGFNIAVF
jgi:hypothetical protein